MPLRDQNAGRSLPKLRQRTGLSLTDVEKLTRKLARKRRDPRLRVPKARLSDIEAKGRIPSIYCLHALASAYDSDIRSLLGFYGLKS